MEGVWGDRSVGGGGSRGLSYSTAAALGSVMLMTRTWQAGSSVCVSWPGSISRSIQPPPPV